MTMVYCLQYEADTLMVASPQAPRLCLVRINPAPLWRNNLIKRRTLPAGQFMGNTVHRTQHFTGDRSFIPIEVHHKPPVKPVENDHVTDALRYAASNAFELKREKNTIAHIIKGLKAHAKVMTASPPRGGGKSWISELLTGGYSVRTVPAIGQWGGSPEVDEHPMRSAFAHADPDREVPLVELTVAPTFYMDGGVDAALGNSIEAVGEAFSDKLVARLHELRAAQYKPPHIYRPDTDPTPQQASRSIFTRDTLKLPVAVDGGRWVLDCRHALGVYRTNGRAWLGVYLHGVANRSKSGSVPWARNLSPGPKDEAGYAATHRGQVDPRSLFFDMFVMVEPEIVTEEWGWGEELEELTKLKSENLNRDLKAENNNATYGGNRGHAWDNKARNHKTATQLATDVAIQEHRDYELGLQLELASAQRERARKVLYKYAWKALMLAVIECKQLTVEARQ